VSGLSSNGQLVLQNNGGDDVVVSGDGPFTMPKKLPSGATYSVTVRTQPSSPMEGCAVKDGSGTVEGNDVTTVVVSCTRLAFPTVIGHPRPHLQ
jgi:hypothetical protein